jgi:hypothetical protein
MPQFDGEIKDGESIVFGDLKVLPIALPGRSRARRPPASRRSCCNCSSSGTRPAGVR